MSTSISAKDKIQIVNNRTTQIMNAFYVFILFLTLSYQFDTSSAQCLSRNDIDNNISDTSVASTVGQLIDGSLDFSFKLFKTLEVQKRNDPNSVGIFFSPFSIWSALMVTYIGAKGQTEEQLQNVLGTGRASKETTLDAYRNLLSLNAYNEVSPRRESYSIANKLYFQESSPVRDCVMEMMGPEIDFVDFAGNPEGARSTINQWVERETKNKIQEVVPSGSLDALTKMVIANAVYFKENWQIQFDPTKTRPRRFTLSSRRDILVDMMSVRGQFPYGVSEELQCTGLELPYNGNDLSMLILLPNNRYYGVGVLANRLTPERLQNFLDELYPREVQVSLPKFKLEDQFELSEPLYRMGLRNLFDPVQVDLSEFTGERDITVDAVHHKSYVDVNEEGTEAAAATAVVISRVRPLGPTAFSADFPFIFIIRNNVANVIIFMGAVQKPPEYKRN